MGKYFQVTNPAGITFNVVFVKSGDKYGRWNDVTNKYGQTLVHFHDAFCVDESFGDKGQFVSGYMIDTILHREIGINLQGGVSDWYVTADNIFDIITHIELEKIT